MVAKIPECFGKIPKMYHQDNPYCSQACRQRYACVMEALKGTEFDLRFVA